MSRILLFWMGYPPYPEMDYEVWSGFREEMAGWVIGCFLLTTAVIIGLYWWSARRKKIHKPADLFAPYTPMYWLWLSWVPAVVVFFAYIIEYQRLFNGGAVSYIARAVPVGLWAGNLTFLVAYLLLMWLPGITPAKYRYRPRWLLYRKKGVRP